MKAYNYESKSLQKERARLGRVSEKDFVTRNYLVNIAANWVLYPIVAVWSAFTAGSYLFTNFEKTFNSFWVAIGATILIAIMIEVGKYFFGTSAIDDIYDGVMSEKGPAKVAFILKTLAACAFFYFSITASLNGGRTSAEYYKEQTSPPVLVELDEINNRYDGYIADQEKTKGDARNMTWKGVIVREGQKIIREANSEIARLNKERISEIEQAEKQNADIVSDWESETAKTGVWFTGLAGLGEILAVIILIFCVNYENGGKEFGIDVNVTAQGNIYKIPAADNHSDNSRQVLTSAGKITQTHYRKSPSDKVLTNGLSEADNLELTTADNGAADNVQPLSDKSRQQIGGELSAIEIEATDKGDKVRLSGPIFSTVRKREFDLSDVEDFEKFKASARQSYHRQFVSGEPDTRLTHKARWHEMKKVLDYYGIEYWPKGEKKITYDYKQSDEYLKNNT